jgi:ABC-2 type transport system permease protein
MRHVLDITSKDLSQILRDRKTFMFLLIMPILFTVLYGFAFGGAGQSQSDPRLPVGYLDQDNSWLSAELKGMLASSAVIHLEQHSGPAPADLEKLVTDEKLAAAVIVPAGYGAALQSGTPLKLYVIADSGAQAGITSQGAILAAANRLVSAATIARIASQNAGVTFDETLAKALAAWHKPPVGVEETKSAALVEMEKKNPTGVTFAHTSPGMMIQFAIAGLLTSATLMVTERKTRCMQRLLTTSVSRPQILMGHFLAMFTITFAQFLVLIAFAQFFLKVDYMRLPLATLIVVITTALFIASLGLLIGSLARTDEQAIIFSLIPMFVFAGLGGAWVPLEVTGKTFQVIGHITPVAWAMDGFKNIVARGLGTDSIWLPAAALMGYAVLFSVLAIWRFKFE